MRMNSTAKNSISTQLFQLIFGLYCLIAVSVTSVQIFGEYRYTQKDIADELKSYQNIFGPVLAKALWNLDREQINDITQGFVEVPIIVGIKIVRSQNNELIHYAERKSKQFSNDLDDKFSYSFPIEYIVAGSAQPLGQAIIYSDSSIVFERVKLSFTFLIVNALIKGIALWFIFRWASKKLLIHPLNKLTNSISNLSYDNLSSFDIDLKIEKENELSIIEQAFSNMVAEISKAKKHVTSFNKRLENEVKQRTIALEKSKNDAEALAYIAESSTQAKSNFLATISHELRTPMNGIQGMLYLLEQGELNDKQRQQIEVASSSSKGLLRLIDDILDLSTIEAGKFKIDNSEFDIFPIFNELVKSLKLGLNDNIELILEAEDLRYLQAIGDPLRLHQILNNLIGNAIKFTSRGNIKITANLKRDIEPTNNKCQLNVSVEDTGIGIAEENLGHLFDSFTQADSSTTREYGGSGLGLTICKRLSESMGGDINVSSQLGVGSCFSFYILLKNVEQIKD